MMDAKIIGNIEWGKLAESIKPVSMDVLFEAGKEVKQAAIHSIAFVEDKIIHQQRDSRGRLLKIEVPAGYRLIRQKKMAGHAFILRQVSPKGTPPHTHAKGRKGLRDFIDTAKDAKAGSVLVGLVRAAGILKQHEIGSRNRPRRPFLVPAMMKMISEMPKKFAGIFAKVGKRIV
jgi:hypothetical protein